MIYSPFAQVRWSTVLAAIAIFAVVGIWQRRPLQALAAVFAWAALFETLYHVVGIVGYHWPLDDFFWGTAAVSGWIILAAVLGVWPEWRLTLLFVALMAVWIAAGFQYNVPGQTAPISVSNEILNEVAKTMLALAYLVGALWPVPVAERLRRITRLHPQALIRKT